MPTPTYAIVGASGLVGQEILTQLHELGVESEHVEAFASERTEGEEVGYGDETLEVQKIEADSFRNKAVALICTPKEVAEALAKKAQSAGCWVVDTSSALIQKNEVCYIAGTDVLKPEIGKTVAVVNGATEMLNVLVKCLVGAQLNALRIDATFFVPASHLGRAGIRALEKETSDLLSAREPDTHAFRHRLAFNLIPQVLDQGAVGVEFEKRIILESIRSFGPDVAARFRASSIAVPVFYGTSALFSIACEQSVNLESLKNTASKISQIKWLDDSENGVYPMPMLAVHDSAIQFGLARATGHELKIFASVDAVRNTAMRAAHLAKTLASA